MLSSWYPLAATHDAFSTVSWGIWILLMQVVRVRCWLANSEQITLTKQKQKKTNIETSIVCTLYPYCILIVYNINLSIDLFCPYFSVVFVNMVFIPEVFVTFFLTCEWPPSMDESGSSRSAECTGCFRGWKCPVTLLFPVVLLTFTLPFLWILPCSYGLMKDIQTHTFLISSVTTKNDFPLIQHRNGELYSTEIHQHVHLPPDYTS